MSFLQRNEYLLAEIEYYNEQICNRLTDDSWSENYRGLWDVLCLQLNWHSYAREDTAQNRLINRLLRHTRYGRIWPFDSPILAGQVALLKNESVACTTLFDFQLFAAGNGSWEPMAFGIFGLAETLITLRVLPYIDNFVDVGAKTGYYSFLAAQHGMAVIAMESSPQTYQLLKAGKDVNGFTNIKTLHCTVGETATGGAFYIENAGKVRALSLNDYRAAVSMIRLSVSGVEMSLLQGAQDWLGSYDAPIILVETGLSPEGAVKSNPGQLLTQLEKFNYSIYAINPKPDHGSQLIAPVNSRGWDRPVPSYFALPPMAKDLEEPLEKIIDMRVFTPTAKLENLHHFVKTSFENL